ncbi:hypothetical protein BYT27DRAFT_7254501 [Phlegmacium glaucopus]|nr:hypothetical protein BYT27DRAFT_7254501 [Phlegmacium glaucopus]
MTSLGCISWTSWTLKNVIWRERMPGNRILEEREWFSEILHEKRRSTRRWRWFWAGVNMNYALEIHSCLLSSAIHQSNLFRTLPNYSRLLELINIFDSEQQPPGSFIRSRHSLPPKNPNPLSSQHFSVRYGIGVEWGKTVDTLRLKRFRRLDERLLDVSTPTLLHQTFPIEPFNDDDDSLSALSTSIARTTDDIDKAPRRISVLETELEESNKAAVESLQELSKDKLRSSDLESRIEGLELALELERKEVHENVITPVLDADGYGGMLEVARKGRYDALDLVHEICKLISKTRIIVQLNLLAMVSVIFQC